MGPEMVAGLPSGWRNSTLGEAGSWLSGGTPSKAREDYWAGSVPWVSPKDMKRFSLGDTQDHLSEQGAANGTRMVPIGSVFIVVRGMILAHTFPVCVAERDMAFNQDVKAILPADGLDGRFLAHWLHGRSDAMLRLVTEATHGTKRIDLRDLQAHPLPRPPLPEQRQIAEVLDTVDEAIRRTEQIIAKLKQVKQGLLHDLLTRGIDDNGELRDPDRHPEQFKDSPLGRIPKGWGVAAFGSLCASSAFGPRFSSDHYSPDGALATLRTTDMDDEGNICLDTMPRAAINPASFSSHLLETGDLVISRSGTCGIAGVFQGYEVAVVPGAFLIRFRLAKTELAPFYRRYFNSSIGRPRLARLAVGGVQKNIKGSEVLALHVPVVSEPEARGIVSSIEAKEKMTATEERETAKLRLLKTGLMEDLLTGRVRVTPLLEDAAE